jgi:3-oxoacyl-[acyl-carrier-protein] synthase II
VAWGVLLLLKKALEDAGLLHADILKVAMQAWLCGSSAGSVDAVREFGSMLIEHNMSQLNATTYIRMMSHTSAVNMTVYKRFNAADLKCLYFRFHGHWSGL